MKMIGKVNPETHKELKHLSIELGATMSKTIQLLLDSYSNKGKIMKDKTPIK